MPDLLRHARCGCTWLVGGDDHGCADDDCRCTDHHHTEETE